MNSRTLLALFLVIVVIVIGVVLIMNKGQETTMQPGEPTDITAAQDTNRLFWFNEPTESGLTEYDFSSLTSVAATHWDSNIIKVWAWGAPDGDVTGQTQAYIVAEEVARMRAYAKLLSTIEGVSVRYFSTLTNQVDFESILQTRSEGFIQGARQVSAQRATAPDGSIGVVVCLEYRIEEMVETMEEVVPEVRVEETYDAPEETNVIAGIVVDARSIGAMPGLRPRLLDEDGNVLYEAAKVNREALENRRAISYRNTLEAAQQLDFIGARALVVTAVRATGPTQSDLIVSNEDAEQIRNWNERTACLARGAVAFVLAPIRG